MRASNGSVSVWLSVAALAVGCSLPAAPQSEEDTAGPGTDVPGRCADPCPTVGVTGCNGAGITVCQSGDDGCATWGPTTACPDDGNPCTLDSCNTDTDACGIPAVDGTPCGTDGQTCQGGQCGGGGDCDRQGLAAVGQWASYDAGESIWYVGVQAADDLPADALEMEFYAADGGPDGPGTYTIANLPLEDCTLCVAAYRNRRSDTTWDKAYVAVSGSVEIASLGDVGGTASGTLRDARFVEATVDPASGASTPVAGGETWCIDDLAFSAVVEAN